MYTDFPSPYIHAYLYACMLQAEQQLRGKLAEKTPALKALLALNCDVTLLQDQRRERFSGDHAASLIAN